MNPTLSANNPPSQKVLSFHYFIHFCIMGVFLPYFNLYCYHLNFSEFQIGIMSAARILLIVFFSIAWGTLTDFIITRKKAYAICTFLSTFIWCFFFFTTDFWPMLIIILAHSVFYGPLIAFLETYSLEVLKSTGESKTHYGTLRVWGSISFIIISVLLGPVINIFSIKIIIPLILAFSAIQAVFSVKMPATTILKKAGKIKSFKRFFSIRTCLFLTASFLMLVSHGTYYGFFSIHLEKAGYNFIFIGIAWGLASLAEITVMLKSHLLFKHYSIDSILIVSLLTSSVRWLILFYSTSAAAILFSQLLHAITYGAFHIACILYIDKLTSKETKTFGQIINNSASYGLGMMCGLIINGIYFERYGVALFIFSSISSLIGCVVLLTSFRFKITPAV